MYSITGFSKQVADLPSDAQPSAESVERPIKAVANKANITRLLFIVAIRAALRQTVFYPSHDAMYKVLLNTHRASTALLIRNTDPKPEQAKSKAILPLCEISIFLGGNLPII